MLSGRFSKSPRRAYRAKSSWTRIQFFRFFPYAPHRIYRLIEAAGFSPEAFRSSAADLLAGLPSSDWSTAHFAQFVELETKAPRCFPIDLDFDVLETISTLRILPTGFHKASIVRGLIQSRIDFDARCTHDPHFWTKSLAIIARLGRPMLVIGDSHSLIYRQTAVGPRGRLTIPLQMTCGGGSATGLSNRNSRSGYGAQIRKTALALDEARSSGSPPVNVLFTFGQVDVEFVHTYRRLRDKRHAFDEARFDAFCSDVVERYVDWVSTLGLGNAVLVGINPPCLDDDFIREGYILQMRSYLSSNIVDGEAAAFDALVADVHLLELPCKARRTAQHRRFNDFLRETAERRGLFYIDRFSTMVGDNGSIKPIYACAGDGQPGLSGRDIHVGGRYAAAEKAALMIAVPDAS